MQEQAARHYQNQQILTASPVMLVFMLYDKAIACLKESIRAIAAGEIEARCKANTRVIEIVSHLRSTLDHEKGGEISQNLDRLYGFILSLLPKVDFNNDAKTAQTVIDLLAPLRESWKTLAAQGDAPLKEAARIAAEMRSATRPATAQTASVAAVAGAPKSIESPDRPRIAISA
jgi:flagellar protein FliS